MTISKAGKITVWLVGGEDVRLRIPIIKSLKALGFAVAAVGSESSEPFDKEGIEYHRYHLKRGIAPFSDRRSLRELVALFRHHRPDVVHAFDTKPALFVPKAARLANLTASVRTVTGMGYVYSSHSPIALALRVVYRLMQKHASELADTTVFQNEDDMEYFISTQLADKNKSLLVRGSGVDIDLLEKQKPTLDERKRLASELNLNGEVVVTMIARLVKHKGVVEFLEAARRVKRDVPNCRFLLVGPLASEGSQAVSQDLIESYSDAVHWLGQRSDVPSILDLTDIFVLPSFYREGVPRVLLEAGALGLPLITTDMPGCRDVVHDDEQGLLVKARDSEELATAIIKLSMSSGLRLTLGKSARKRVEENFTLNQVAAAYGELYRRLV